jgi:exodeoxyribonuclease VIII
MKTGVYSDISNADYHGGAGVSKSGLDLIARSPLHYWGAYLDPHREPRKETTAMAVGTAIHTAILEPDTFGERYVILPEGLDRRTTAGKASYEAVISQACATGAEVISANDAAKVLKIAAYAHAHPVAKAMFSDGKAEQSVFWTDDETGVLCKCRPDWLLGGENPAVLDVKSTLDASPDEFARSAFKWRYHVQAAWYLDGVEAATGLKPDSFMFLAVEKEAPFASAYYYADDDMIRAGRAEYRRALRVYADCLASGKWTGYTPKLLPLGLPKWADIAIEVDA